MLCDSASWFHYRKASNQALRVIARSMFDELPWRELTSARNIPGFGSYRLLSGGNNSAIFNSVIDVDAVCKALSLQAALLEECDLIGSFREMNFYLDEPSFAQKNGRVICEVLESVVGDRLINFDAEVARNPEAYLGIFDSHLDQSIFHIISYNIYCRLTGFIDGAPRYNIGTSIVPQELLGTTLPFELIRVFEAGEIVYHKLSLSGHIGSVWKFYNCNALCDQSIFIFGTSSCYSGLTPFLTHYFREVTFFWGASIVDLNANEFALNEWRDSMHRVVFFRDRFIVSPR